MNPREHGLERQRGASSVEYGLLIAAIAALVAVAVYALGGMTDSAYDHTCTEIASAAGSGSC